MEAENNSMKEELGSSGRRSRRAIWPWMALVAVAAVLAGTGFMREGPSRSKVKIQQAIAEAQQLTEAILAYENFGKAGMPSPLKNKVTGETWQEATEDKLSFVLGKEQRPNGQNEMMPALFSGTVRDGKICDPWGRAYRYRIMLPAGNDNVSGHAKDYVVGVWSLGPDGEPNSGDDICTWPDSKRSADGKARFAIFCYTICHAGQPPDSVRHLRLQAGSR